MYEIRILIITLNKYNIFDFNINNIIIHISHTGAVAPCSDTIAVFAAVNLAAYSSGGITEKFWPCWMSDFAMNSAFFFIP